MLPATQFAYWKDQGTCDALFVRVAYTQSALERGQELGSYRFHTLSGRIGKVVASHAAVERSIPLRCTDLCYARGAQGVLPMRVGGATSQLDLPSLMPLSVAGE